MRPALQFHLGHHLVGDDLGDQPDEPVAGGAADGGGVFGAGGLGPGETRQLGAVDDLAAGGVVGAVSCPARTHLRTVSSLTPSRRAASDNRNCGMTQTLSPQLRKSYAGRELCRISARSCSRMTF